MTRDEDGTLDQEETVMSGEERRDALPAGYQLHEYLFERVLGAGGFGITYLAKDVSLGTRQVAIKEYLPKEIAIREGQSVHARSAREQGEYENGLRRFIREARTLGEFHHENIVRVVRLIEGVNNTAYMVMEYEEGESLERLLERRSAPPDEEMLRHILYPLIAGLEEVHGKGFLHRDIKPGNIYIRRKDASPVLLDFGLARQAVGGSRSAYAALTPGYAPIEQYESQSEQGSWTDIYALGAVMYRAISGTVPPESVARSNAVHVNKGKDPMTPAVQVGKGRYSRVFLRAIDHALAIRAKERPQSVVAWREEFEGSFPWHEARRHLPMAGGMLAVGVLAVVGWQGWSGREYEIEVRSEPPGAELTVDGVGYGVTPWHGKMKGGDHELQLSRAGYQGYVQRVEIKADTGVLTPRLEGLPGKLEVTSIPPGAEIFVDGQKLAGQLTPAKLTLDPGKKRVEVRKACHHEQQGEVELLPGETAVKRFELAKRCGDLSIVSTPVGVAVKVDGEARGETPLRLANLESGSHRIELAKAGHDPLESEVVVKAGQGVEVVKDLKTCWQNGQPGKVCVEEETGIEFVWVPGGCYQMGLSENEIYQLEKDKYILHVSASQHKICVDPLWVGRTEVTVGQFSQFVSNTNYKTYAEIYHDHDVYSGKGCSSIIDKNGEETFEYMTGRNWRNPGYYQQDDFPVVCVSFHDAQAYVKWMNEGGIGKYRLMTEAEWEFAARGGMQSTRYWGDDPDMACRYGNVCDESFVGSGAANKNGMHHCNDGYIFSASVGKFMPNKFGLYDMLGNVSEWTCSEATPDYDGEEKKCGDGRLMGKIHRGGDYSDIPDGIRSALRRAWSNSYRTSSLGFRLSRTYP